LKDSEWRIANGESPIASRQSLPLPQSLIARRPSLPLYQSLIANRQPLPLPQSPVANRQFLLLPFFVPRPSSLAPFPSVVVKPFCWRP
jgi:hypothetical protein